MVRNCWYCWEVKSVYEVELQGVSGVVFGRVKEGVHECVVYVSKALRRGEAVKLFDKAFHVEHARGRLISMKQAIKYFGEEGPYSSAFDYVHQFTQ